MNKTAKTKRDKLLKEMQNLVAEKDKLVAPYEEKIKEIQNQIHGLDFNNAKDYLGKCYKAVTPSYSHYYKVIDINVSSVALRCSVDLKVLSAVRNANNSFYEIQCQIMEIHEFLDLIQHKVINQAKVSEFDKIYNEVFNKFKEQPNA